MLQELHIESLGVIDTLDIVLGAGFTALTGETGAGKTMLVEAISLLVGGRADATMVRSGCAEARVEGRFDVDGEEIIVARVIPADGRSRAYVNGRLATVANLAELGLRTVDLHGQHAHQSLLSAAAQREALDRFCGTDTAPLREARARLTEIDAALAALGGDTRSRAREIDLLRFQVDELDAAAIRSADEDDELARTEDTLADAAAHRAAAEGSSAALTEEDGALDQVGRALAQLNGRGPFEAIARRLRSLQAELTDAASDLRSAAESIEEDAEQLETIRLRRQLLRDLRRKYGETLPEVIEFHREAAERLHELQSYDLRVADLEAQRVIAERAERAAAAAVGAQRRGGAAALAEQVQQRLRDLAMPHAALAVVVGDEDPGDEVSFLLAANPGSPLLPLARVASGGELARSMLALRLVLTEAPDSLVFDEVDAGIGGAAAIAVGEALAALATRHQVLVVTHLPQVAAMADKQLTVSKRVESGQTFATAVPLVGSDRIDEIARMLSGGRGGESARRHAADLLGDRCR
jgi:DNA repair protein RecN (Recombination protein N)